MAGIEPRGTDANGRSTALRLLVLSLTALILLAALTTLNNAQQHPPARAAGETQGDVDCSTAADSIDALKVLLAVSGLPYTADCLEAAGDVDCSGARDSIDALRILGFVAGLPFTPPPGCTPIGQPLGPPGPPSFDLIDAAEKDGDIDHEAALTYKVFAAFNDDRLPAQFRSNAVPDTDAGIMAEVVYSFETFSPQTQEMLAPYLLPPNDEASWHYERHPAAAVPQATAEQPCPECPNALWGRIITANDKVKVWYQVAHPEDQAKAQAIADALDSHIWDSLADLMGREPLSDAGKPSNGHDGRLDMYIIDEFGFLGEMIPYEKSGSDFAWLTNPCKKSPAYLLLSRVDTELVETAGHELFHALQFAFDSKDSCGQRHWMQEATSTWAEDFLYPDHNVEHRRTYYFEYPSIRLDKSDDNIGHYGRYVFFLYLTREHGDEVMRTIWENTEQYATILEAIDRAIPGGFKEFWPEFAIALWNHAPFDRLNDADGITTEARPRDLTSVYTFGTIDIAIPENKAEFFVPYSMGASVDGLTTHYYQFHVADDEAAGAFGVLPYVRFFNPYFKDHPAFAKVQALVKIGGTWALEDWTDLKERAFCRQLEAERVTDVVLMVSNGGFGPVDTLFADSSDDWVTARNTCVCQAPGGGAALNPQGASSYSITDLGALGGDTSSAEDVNDDGTVVGMADNADGYSKPVVWLNGAITELPGIDPNGYGSALGINDDGVISGYVTNEDFSPVYGAIWKKDPGGQYQLADHFAIGGNDTYAWGINNAGDAVGATEGAEDQAFIREGQTGATILLPGLEAHAEEINDHRQIAGTIGDQAAVWEETQQGGWAVTILPQPPGGRSVAWDINRSGDIVGTTTTSSNVARPAMWSQDDQGWTLRDLGTLFGYSRGQANAVNNFGQAVGGNTTGVLADVPAFAGWDIGGCGIRNLYSYLPPTEGYRFFLMTGISETQYISLAAYQGGTTDGDVHAFLMVPQ